MTDYISREDALICLPQYPENYTNEQAKNFLNGYYQMWKNVENCAAADVVEKKHGHWRKMNMACYGGGTIREYECSVCEEHQIARSDFCPNCGAWMRGNDDEKA